MYRLPFFFQAPVFALEEMLRLFSGIIYLSIRHVKIVCKVVITLNSNLSYSKYHVLINVLSFPLCDCLPLLIAFAS